MCSGGAHHDDSDVVFVHRLGKEMCIRDRANITHIEDPEEDD